MSYKGIKFNGIKKLEVPKKYIKEATTEENSLKLIDNEDNETIFKVNIDEELSETSKNPVQNKVITAELNSVKQEITRVDETIQDKKDINVNAFDKEFTAGYSDTEVSNEFTWVQATSPTGFDARQRNCAYGNGYYVISGTSGQLAYSQDGINWTSGTAFSTNVITGLAYGNGYFLAVDSGGNIYRTDIPSNVWTLVYTNPIIIESIRYINNKFFTVGQNGFIGYSDNGSKWKQVDALTENTFIDVGYGNGKYVAVGSGGSIYTSINGEIWYNQTSENLTTDIRAIMYANGQFVIGTSDGRIDYSTDGVVWATANNPSAKTISWIRNFTYTDNRLYVVMYASDGTGEIWLSKDKGTTWEVAQTTSGRLWCIASGNDKFIASGDAGAIYVLDLKLEWKKQPTGAKHEWYRFKVAQNDGSFVYSDVYVNTGGGSSSGGSSSGGIKEYVPTSASDLLQFLETNKQNILSVYLVFNSNVSATYYSYEKVLEGEMTEAEAEAMWDISTYPIIRGNSYNYGYKLYPSIYYDGSNVEGDLKLTCSAINGFLDFYVEPTSITCVRYQFPDVYFDEEGEIKNLAFYKYDQASIPLESINYALCKVCYY